MARKVNIESLFPEAEEGQLLGEVTFWDLAYLFGQTALFDDLKPKTWEEIFWARTHNGLDRPGEEE